jgi:multidrug resistance efflux pump
VRYDDPDEARRLIATAEAHVAAQRAEAERLHVELARLNASLGAARRAQEHLQNPVRRR